MSEEIEKKVEPKKKGNGLLIALIVLIVIAAAGGFLWLRNGAASKGAGQEAKETGEGHGEANKEIKEGAGTGTVYNLDPFIVNLQDNSGTRYLKLTVNLELTQSSSSAELAAQNTKIRDSLIILLSSKSYTDIGTVEGKYQLRDEIVARVNQFLVKSKVKTAYFTDFVIQ